MCYVLKVSLGFGKEFAHESIVMNNNEWTRNNHNTSNMPKHKRKYMKRAKHNGDLTSTKTFACPDGRCGKVFASKQGVSNHYLHYSAKSSPPSKACRITTFTTLNATRFRLIGTVLDTTRRGN
jgi:hypothetical protein